MRGRSPVPRRSRGARGDAFGLAVSTWVRLLKVHGLVLREVRRRIPAPLTVPQFDVMAQLARRREGMTPGELTRELVVTAGNVTGIVERLRLMGYVTRSRVPEDRRAVRVSLTPEGRAAFAKILPRHRRQVATLFAGFPDDGLESLRKLLGGLMHAVEGRRG